MDTFLVFPIFDFHLSAHTLDADFLSFQLPFWLFLKICWIYVIFLDPMSCFDTAFHSDVIAVFKASQSEKIVYLT